MAFEPRLGVTLRTAVLSEAILTYLLNLVIIYSTRELLLLLLNPTNDWDQAKLKAAVATSHTDRTPGQQFEHLLQLLPEMLAKDCSICCATWSLLLCTRISVHTAGANSLTGAVELSIAAQPVLGCCPIGQATLKCWC